MRYTSQNPSILKGKKGGKNWVSKVAKSIKKRGTEGTFTSYCKGKGFDGVTNECISQGKKAGGLTAKRANLAKSFRGMSKKKGDKGFMLNAPGVSYYPMARQGALLFAQKGGSTNSRKAIRRIDLKPDNSREFVAYDEHGGSIGNDVLSTATKAIKNPYIPAGRLHRFNHNISDAKVGAVLTKKGIPVITKSCDDKGNCEVAQTAEIEAAEIIFPGSQTKQLEKLVYGFNRSKDSNTLLKLGKQIKKFLAKTEDATGKFTESLNKIK